MPEGERTLKDILVRPENPLLDAAEKRADEVVSKAQPNEAIRIIETLEAEVGEMHISNRYKRDKKPSESAYAHYAGSLLNPTLKNLTEDEFKRQILLNALQAIKTDVARAVGKIHDVVLDIEATKIDD